MFNKVRMIGEQSQSQRPSAILSSGPRAHQISNSTRSFSTEYCITLVTAFCFWEYLPELQSLTIVIRKTVFIFEIRPHLQVERKKNFAYTCPCFQRTTLTSSDWDRFAFLSEMQVKCSTLQYNSRNSSSDFPRRPSKHILLKEKSYHSSVHFCHRCF